MKTLTKYKGNATTIGQDEIPLFVTTIGEKAFENCSALTSIIILSSVTTIIDSAFDNCTNISLITIPNNTTLINLFSKTNFPNATVTIS